MYLVELAKSSSLGGCIGKVVGERYGLVVVEFLQVLNNYFELPCVQLIDKRHTVKIGKTMLQSHGSFVFVGRTVLIETTSYRSGGGVCVLANTPHGSLGTLSTNLHGHPQTNVGELEPDEFVLNHDYLCEFGKPYLTAFLASGLFEETGKTCDYGYCCDVPIWRLVKNES
jgi:hypothetical protein